MLILFFSYSLLICEAQNSTISIIPPPAYSGISSVYYNKTQTFYFLSGIDSNGDYLTGLQQFYFDPVFNTWRYSEETGSYYPDKRSNYGSFLYKNRYYYIFGGIGPSSLYNDIWSFDLIYNIWANIPNLTPISPRYNFAFTSFTDDDGLFYFAVLGGKGYYSSSTLFDFYFYLVQENKWIQKQDYTICSPLALAGAQLQYYQGNLYLFSGVSLQNNTADYYNAICEYNIDTNQWSNFTISSPNFNSNQGGSCIYEGSIYNFFGWSFKGSLIYSLSNVTRLDLENIKAGWTSVSIQEESCSSSILERNSFGFNCVGSQLYVNGGNTNSVFQNSIINITLSAAQSTLTCQSVYSEMLWPRRRHGSSIVYITGGLYLFGGIDQGVLMNDLWFYNLTSDTWLEIQPSGHPPSPRYRHAASSQGNYMVIMGGLTYNDEYLQDFYYYNCDVNSWFIITPDSKSIAPPPIYGSCLVLDFPKFYYVGGKEEFQLTLSIWQYDFTTSLFTNLYQYNPAKDIPIYKHGCSLEYDENDNKIITTYYGSQTVNDVPFCGIQFFNISSTPPIHSLMMLDSLQMPCRTDPIYANLGYGYILFAGGQRYKQEAFSDVWILDINGLDAVYITDLDFPVYSSAFGFINESLYIFSGFSDNGISVYSRSNDYFQKVFIDAFEEVLSDYHPCGAGMFYNNKSCEFCKPGTFSSIYSNTSCSVCPNGTVSLFSGATDETQCVPCPFGYYSISSINQCISCENTTNTCYIGTGSFPINKTAQKWLDTLSKSSSQPGFYKPTNISNERITLYIVASSIIGFFTLLVLLSYQLRILLSYYDFYKNLHFEEHATAEGIPIPKEQLNKPSKLGGFCSVITIIVLLFLTTNSILTYVKTNETEEVILVPIDSLIKEKNFSSQTFTLEIILPSYRGDCDSDDYYFASKGSIQTFSYRSFRRAGAICNLTFQFQTYGVINSGDQIEFVFDETFSYSSEIYVRLTTSSSVPGEVSRVIQNVTSDLGLVFRGSEPTIFSFSILPSLYSSTNLLDDGYESLGYRLSTTLTPTLGSQSDIADIAISTGFSIVVEFFRSDIGITTFRYPLVPFVDFFFKAINDFPGPIVVIGLGVWLVEYLRNLCKGKTSGRIKLARKQIEIEKEKRRMKKERRKRQHEDSKELIMSRNGINESFT